MTDHEENSQAKTTSGAKKRNPAKKRAVSKTRSTPDDSAHSQATPSGEKESGRVAMSATQRRLEEMGMIDSGTQKSSASAPSAMGFRIMVVIALVFFVAAVFFIRANSHRSAVEQKTTGEPVSQVTLIEDEPQSSDLSNAYSESDGEITDDSAPTKDTSGLVSSDEQAAATLAPPPGMMEERGGMGYHAPGMQPPPPMMGENMMPHAIAPANPDSMQPYPPGPAFQNGQPMQPMMGYGYGPSGPYYWFIVPIPQHPGTGGPAVPDAAGQNGYDVVPPAYNPSYGEESPETDEEVERPY